MGEVGHVYLLGGSFQIVDVRMGIVEVFFVASEHLLFGQVGEGQLGVEGVQ